MLKAYRDPLSDVFGKELKMCPTNKITVNAEIEGCWVSPKARCKCRACGAIQTKVPRKGHANSAFWVNEQPDGMILIACPNECTEKEAAECMEEFLDYVAFKKGDSWSWEWDYTKIQYGWITPDCRLLICNHMGHLEALYDEEIPIIGHFQAEKKGYIKFTGDSEIEFSWGKKPNKRQVRIMRDCMTDRGYALSEADEHWLTQENHTVSSCR